MNVFRRIPRPYVVALQIVGILVALYGIAVDSDLIALTGSLSTVFLASGTYVFGRRCASLGGDDAVSRRSAT